MTTCRRVVLLSLVSLIAIAATAPADYIRVSGHRVALTHVRVIDGTGGPAKTDQTVIISDGKVAAVGPSSAIQISGDTQVLELRAHTVIPGLVGMHDHLFYFTDGGRRWISVPRSFSRLYLAAGVTTIRTGGTIDLQKDLAMKRAIDEGREAGPKIHLTSPYLNAAPSIQAVIAAVDTFADAGVTSIKAYTTLRRDELSAAIGAAHRRGLKITGHLCAVGFRQAAGLGIDNLEHGLIVDSEFYSRRVPDECPDAGAIVSELVMMDVNGQAIQETIRQLVSHGVALTSTLAIFETFTGRETAVDPRAEPFLNRSALSGYRSAVAQRQSLAASLWIWDKMLKMEMAFERSFALAGGLLMAGSDPTGWGGLLAGLGDQRNVELLVEAGFTPEQAIQVATANGARFLGQSADIGTIEAGKHADLVVLRGDVTSDISAIRDPDIVFKDGVGYDSASLFESVAGSVGEANLNALRAIGIAVCVVSALAAARYLSRARGRGEAKRPLA